MNEVKIELLKRLVCFKSITKSYSECELVVTERKILHDVLKEHRRMGRIITLPADHCDYERCKRFNEQCMRCIKDFYNV